MGEKTIPAKPAREPGAASGAGDGKRAPGDANSGKRFDAALKGKPLPGAGPARTAGHATPASAFTVADAIAARPAAGSPRPDIAATGRSADGAPASPGHSGTDVDPGSESTPATGMPELGMPGTLRFPAAMPASATPEAFAAADDELLQLMQDMCSKLYVGKDRPAAGARMYLALDNALRGAGVELVRQGAFLTVRLHARNDTAFRLLSSRRSALHEALGEATDLKVVVEVVRQQDASDNEVS